LDFQPNGSLVRFTIEGESRRSGQVSLEELMPGTFSILLENESLLVHVSPRSHALDVWVNSQRYNVKLADLRDDASANDQNLSSGPVELRAQMPGRVVKLLASQGERVTTGQGVIVVEAMKMQNEVKSPKDGIVVRIHVAEGSTVGAGDTLAVVE
jgi:biotin carboxyl carrier protein